MAASPSALEAERKHTDMPPLAVVEVERGRHWLAFGAADPAAKASGFAGSRPAGSSPSSHSVSTRCRFISRYRTATSDDLRTTLTYGGAIEPIGFAMDRRMLLGLKARAERRR
jgi:hypothetical protein